MNILFFVFFIYWVPLLFAEDYVMQTVNIPMRDGAVLPTDVYLPNEAATGLPCILIRSPGGRTQRTCTSYLPLVKNGYALAIQGTRSSLDPEGKALPYRSDGWHEQKDGYDTIEWLAKNAWTNGKIGTLGFSAQGITQLLLAPSTPPSLRCQYIGFAVPTLRDHAIFPNKKLLKHQVEEWLGYYARDTGVFSFVVNQQFNDEFWDEFDSLKVVDRVNVPGFFQGAWYDIFIQGTLDAFTARQEKGGEGARKQQKLIVGPWTHFWPSVTRLGDYEIPLEAQRIPIDLSPTRWFDFYLKGEKNEVSEIPPITYYVMGPFDGSPSKGNQWKFADHWPVPSKETSWYLSGSELVTEWPAQETTTREFLHDPTNPIPTIGGHNLYAESGPMDQQPIEKREDILLFTTPPLTEDLEITGRIKAMLFVSSDCKDTDFIVRLTDVYPDGKSVLISDGAVRIGFLTIGDALWSEEKCQEVDIDLGSTSLVFAKGHRIRISIGGSSYPRYDINQNIGLLGSQFQKNIVARNKIHFGKETPSRIIFPVIE